MKIVDDTLTLHSDTTTPINVEDALITAAIDENIHLDCVYFLLQRQPDVLVKLLLSQSVAASSINDNNNKNRYENENGILMVRIVVDNKRLR
jgi:hypothetical protein